MATTNKYFGQILSSGKGTTTKSLASFRHFEHYALVYVFDGEGFYRDEAGRNLSLRKGDIIFVFPELGHRYGAKPGKTWSEFYIIFDGTIFDLWKKSGFLNISEPVRHIEPVEYWMRRLQSIADLQHESENSKLVRVCQFQLVLSEIFEAESLKSVSSEDQGWMTKVKRMMDQTGSIKKKLPDIADDLNMGYESFRKKFIHLFGCSPGRYRMTRIIDHTKKLMQTTTLTNKEIAESLGFADAFHFSHRFRIITAMSPKQFRKSLIHIR
jgi:AraC-like DNA-binding protein